MWKSEPKPAANFKEVRLEKRTSAIVRSGINFAALSAVKNGIADGTRPEVGELPYGEWKIDANGNSMFPYVIETKTGDQIRMYPSDTKASTIYHVNGEVVEKDKFASYLTPSDAKKLYSDDRPLCFNVKRENVLGIEDFEG